MILNKEKESKLKNDTDFNPYYYNNLIKLKSYIVSIKENSNCIKKIFEELITFSDELNNVIEEFLAFLKIKK